MCPLPDAQQLRLQRHGIFADLIEQQAPIGSAVRSSAVALVGAGEASLFRGRTIRFR